MILADVCVRRPVFATMLIGVLVVAGWFSYKSLTLELMPKVEMPVVTVTTTLAGSGPEEIEAQVTKIIEEAINTVSAPPSEFETSDDSSSEQELPDTNDTNLSSREHDPR